MLFKKVNYETDLNHRQKENYNFHKIAALLADYGFNSIRLYDDYEGADFLAIHINSDILKVQLKGRLTFERKYIGKDLYICFCYRNDWYIYPHDELWESLGDTHNARNTASWIDAGSLPHRAIKYPIARTVGGLQTPSTHRLTLLRAS